MDCKEFILPTTPDDRKCCFSDAVVPPDLQEDCVYPKYYEGRLYKVVRSTMRFRPDNGVEEQEGFVAKQNSIIMFLDGIIDISSYSGARIRFIYEDRVCHFGGGLCTHSFEEIKT